LHCRAVIYRSQWISCQFRSGPSLPYSVRLTDLYLLAIQGGQLETLQVSFSTVGSVKILAPPAYKTSIMVRLSSPPIVGRAALARLMEGDIFLSFDIESRDKVRFIESLTERGLVGHIQILLIDSYVFIPSRETSSIKVQENFQRLKGTLNLIFNQKITKLWSQHRFAFFPLHFRCLYMAWALIFAAIG